jgi:hypothetical protein
MRRINMRGLWILFVALVAVSMSAAVATAQNPHFVGEPTCVVNQAGDEVTCVGKIAGVGTEPTQVGIDIAGGCANKPGHEPPGHVQSVSEPIEPHGGRINFRESVTVDCPPGLTPVFGEEATIFIIQNGVRTDVGTVPIT